MDGSNPVPIGWAVAMTAGGAAVLWLLWRCWTGRYRKWARRGVESLLVLSWGPPVGFILLGTGLLGLLGDPVGVVAGAVLYLVGFALLVPGLIYAMFRPRWWGPRWLRRMPAGQRTPDLTDAQTALATAFWRPRPDFSSTDRAAQAAAGFGEQLARWRASYIYDPDTRERPHALATRGGVGGTLTLYRGGVTFASSRMEDKLRQVPTVVAIPADRIHEVRVVPPRAGPDGTRRAGVRWRSVLPRLVVTTADHPYLFETTFARRVARAVSGITGRSAS